MCDTSKRLGFIGILVEDLNSVEKVNEALSAHGKLIVGRMGIPYRSKGINVISIAVDAPQDAIAALSGKIGNLPGVSAKTAYSNFVSKA